MDGNIVAYWWTEVQGGRKTDVIKLENIRLYTASVKNGKPRFNSMVPVLMDDGRAPHIVLSSGPVYKLTKNNRYGKLVMGDLTEEEREFSTEVPALFSGDPAHEPTFKVIYDHMAKESSKIPLAPFNAPMWCRKAKSRKDLTPRNNIAMRNELGIIDVDKRQQAAALKKAWDQMAENAHCIGYCTNGFLWDADMIRSGGVVCVPRQYGQKLNIMGTCLRSDMQHIIKTQKWRCKL